MIYKIQICKNYSNRSSGYGTKFFSWMSKYIADAWELHFFLHIFEIFFIGENLHPGYVVRRILIIFSGPVWEENCVEGQSKRMHVYVV